MIMHIINFSIAGISTRILNYTIDNLKKKTFDYIIDTFSNIITEKIKEPIRAMVSPFVPFKFKNSNEYY